jgi:hypothetical protein
MEQAEQVDGAINRSERSYERYGWVILLGSALLGMLAAVLTAIPPEYVRSSPLQLELAYPIMAALGIASVGFYIFAVVMILIPYRRYECWAWYTLWLLPLMWFSHFVLTQDRLYYLALAIITILGLILPYGRFFSGREEGSV